MCRHVCLCVACAAPVAVVVALLRGLRQSSGSWSLRQSMTISRQTPHMFGSVQQPYYYTMRQRLTRSECDQRTDTPVVRCARFWSAAGDL